MCAVSAVSLQICFLKRKSSLSIFSFIRHRSNWAYLIPFFEVYKIAKQTALQLLRNRETLDSQDLQLIETQTLFCASSQSKLLERKLFLLSTIASLGPFFGLLGTVWGILVSLSALPKGSVSNSMMLSGLSMALATTVIGLLIAIPALIGYNYLKNANREYKRELDQFTHLLLAAIEMQHRK